MLTIYNPNPVPVTYTTEELQRVIDSYIKDVKTEFSFRGICAYVIEKAISDGKVRDAHNTRYSSRVMSPLSSIEVSKYLWQLIWNKNIFIAFGENPYSANYNNDTRFIKL